MNKGSEAMGILVSTKRPSNSEFLEIYVPCWEECGSGLSSQKGPRHEGIWPEVSALHSECQRMGDLEGFGAEKEYEVAYCIFKKIYFLILEKEREREWEGQRQRERESQANSPLSGEPNTGSNAQP